MSKKNKNNTTSYASGPIPVPVNHAKLTHDQYQMADIDIDAQKTSGPGLDDLDDIELLNNAESLKHSDIDDLALEGEKMSDNRFASLADNRKVSLQETGATIARERSGIGSVNLGGKYSMIKPEKIAFDTNAFTSARAGYTENMSKMTSGMNLGDETWKNIKKLKAPKEILSDSAATGSKIGRYAMLGVGALTLMGGLTLALSSSRGQQNNAQLYGQQPVDY